MKINNFFLFSDLLPHNLSGQAPTKEFLLKIVDVLIDYIKDVNDRDEKVLHFKQPEEMLRLLNLDLPNEGMPLQTLVDDCSLTLKHQVKTGKILRCNFILILHFYRTALPTATENGIAVLNA